MMNEDEIKKEFIRIMEEKHSGLLYPKKVFGCMMAVFIEQEPVTQERIEELTGYSKTIVSQMLTLIQVNFPVKPLKKLGIRKKYYVVNLEAREFMLTFFRVIIDSYKSKVDFMVPLIEDLSPYTQKHVRFSNFQEFLRKYHETSTLYIDLLTETADDLSSLIKTGKINASELFDRGVLGSQEYLRQVQSLLKPPTSFSEPLNQKIMTEELVEVYNLLKDKFYQKFRENMTSSGSRTAIARAIIGTELLLEQRPLTQEEIESVSGFHRSVISDTLKRLVMMGMVKLIKKPGDRKKYYMMVQSWDARTVGNFRLNVKYAVDMKEEIRSLIARLKQENGDDGNNSLVFCLQHVHHSYDMYGKYFKFLEMKYLNTRLKELEEK